MGAKFIELKIAGSVPGGQSLKATYIPLVGETCYLTEFRGHGPGIQDAVVCACFDDGGDDVILYSTNSDAVELDLNEGPVSGDGAKKMEMILDNSSQDTVIMTGKAIIKVES